MDPEELVRNLERRALRRSFGQPDDPQPGRRTGVPPLAQSALGRQLPRREDPTLARARTGDSDAGQRVMARAIEVLGTEQRAHRQLMLLEEAARDHDPGAMEIVQVPIVEQGDASVSIASVALPELVAACARRHADFQVAAVGPSFDGLAPHVPAARIAELDRFVREFAQRGTDGPGGMDELHDAIVELGRLLDGITGPLDALSAASLRMLGQQIAARVHSAIRWRGGAELDVLHHPDDPTPEEHAERMRRLLEVGREMQHLCANVFFAVELEISGDRDKAEAMAALGAMVDGLGMFAGGAMEAREAAHVPARRDPGGHLLPDAGMILEGGTRAHRPEPEYQQPMPVRESGAERDARRQSDRQQQMEHARRLGRTGRH